MRRVIINPRKAIFFALFLASCITNTVMEDSKQSSSEGSVANEESSLEATLNIKVEIDTLYHKGFTFEGTPIVDIQSLEGEVTKVDEYKFSLSTQPTSNCTVVVSNINIPLANTYGATIHCAITSPVYIYSGEEYDITISFNHNSIDDNGVALLPVPITFSANVVDWNEY